MKKLYLLLVLFLTSYRSNSFELKQPPLINANKTRRNFLGACVVATTTLSFPCMSNAVSYSSNARNLERINSGDFSGGSTYDNNPNTDAGKKRRAMVGCKSSVAREEAAEALGGKVLSEKDCNQQVLGGKSEFMLQALRNLDCPSSPYGICTERK